MCYSSRLRLAIALTIGTALVSVSGITTPSSAAGPGQCVLGAIGLNFGAGGLVVAAYQGSQTPGGIAQQCSFRATDDGQSYTVATPNPWDIKVTNRLNQTRVAASSRSEPYVSDLEVPPDHVVVGPVANGGFHVSPGDRITLTIYNTCASSQCAASGFIAIRD